MSPNDRPFGRIAVLIDEDGYVEDVRTDDPRLLDVTVLVFSRATGEDQVVHLKTQDGRDTGPAWMEAHWPEPNIYDLDEASQNTFGSTDIKAAAESIVAQQIKKN
jgi:hypothetical protein